MDNTRLFLWLALLAMLWLNYDAWLRDRAPAETSRVPSADVTLPQDEVPTIDDAGTDEAPPRPSDAPSDDVADAGAPAMRISVRTDVLDVVIDTQGGDLVRADLLDYPVHKDQPDEIVRLLDFAPQSRWVFQSGRSSANRDGPTHQAAGRAESSSYELAPGNDELVVTLVWEGGDGLDARKVYTFRRGSYEIDLDLVAENHRQEPWRGAPYVRMQRLHEPVERSFTSVESYSFTGPVLYTDTYQKLDVEDLRTDPLTATATGGWIAGIQHHFLAAAVPPPDAPFQYEATVSDSRYLLTAIGPTEQIASDMQHAFNFRLFVGPKLQSQLRETAEGLVLTVDYGILTILAQPLFWVLSRIHDFVGNWGWAIIIVTLLIKLAFYKLTQTSGRSMAKMRKIAPRMKALQERYKDDRQGLSRAMMELYRKEKINPAAGCLPILVQMPFFFAFYWVLIESVEMRQAPFMLWIDDLSSRDPFFVLPLLMGAAMLLQTRLNPAPPDPVQARVMQIMPIVFTAFFALFPSGLVLYWLTNTLVSIAQQWRINKIVAREAA